MLNALAGTIGSMSDPLFAARIRRILDETSLTQAELARMTGRSRAAVNHWLNGSGISPATVFALADATGYAARWIATGKGPPRNSQDELSLSDRALLAGFQRWLVGTDQASREIVRSVLQLALPVSDTVKDVTTPSRAERIVPVSSLGQTDEVAGEHERRPTPQNGKKGTSIAGRRRHRRGAR